MEFKKSESKEWAKQHFRGVEGTIMPSFTPDFSNLDEEGIRWDVQYAISQGYFSVCCTQDACGMSFEERNKFLEIVCDEAKGKILVSFGLLAESIAQGLAQLKHFEKVGGTHVLLAAPEGFDFKSEDEIFQYVKMMCNNTNLLIDFYAPVLWSFAKFHPTGINPKLVSQLADIDNAVAMTCGLGNYANWATYQQAAGDKLLIQFPNESAWPITFPKYRQQWVGVAMHDVYQTPDNHRLIEMYNLFVEGKYEEAMNIYWQLYPVMNFQQGMTMRYGGLHPFILWKYYQWLTGGNGGMLRIQTPRLQVGDRNAIRSALKASKLNISEQPDEVFLVGRVNYAKGSRLKL
jgi:4-hydroxy-tetrahydrodipicolinate synthase